MRPTYILFLAALLAIQPALAAAAVNSEMLELKNTVLNLVDALVASGALTADQAATIKREAALKASEQVAQQAVAAGQVSDAPPDNQPPGQQVVRVPYVPEFVKDQIREEVRTELRAEVTSDVVATAREEGWGTPDALPAWVNRFRWFGDARLMYQANRFENDNSQTIPFFPAINAAGGIAQAGENAFFPSTEDTNWWRVRARFGFDATVNDSVSVVARIATGNDKNPISRNITEGNYFNSYDIILDQVYLQWQNDPGTHAFTLRGGRLPNPFMRSTIIWDSDVVFDGFTAQYSGPFWGGVENHFFANAGVFPLLRDTPNIADGSTDQKWLYGMQAGLDLALAEELSMRVAAGYLDFDNVVGQKNPLNSTVKNWTAPEFQTKGNTVFDIANDNGATNLFALAADFELLDVMTQFTYAGFGPVNVVVTGDYVKNIGYDRDAVFQRTGVDVKERTEAWLVDLTIGWEDIRRFGQWSAYGGYRHVQRDSVLDAFTDSDFHLGGTDTEGWIVGFKYGVATNTWVNARWLSADQIDGEKLAIDVLQVDVNARF